MLFRSVPFFGGVFLERALDTSAAVFRFDFAMFARGSACLPLGGMEAIPRQLAAALPGIWYSSELTEFQGVKDDPWEGIKLEGGVLHVTDAPGCGVTPKEGSGLPRAKR